MNTPEILNIVLLAGSILTALISSVTLFTKVKGAKNITVTRKDTGKSVTVSTRLNRKEIHELAELAK
ncbi:effector-associated constant component EACC1 [Spirosoma litoris]